MEDILGGGKKTKGTQNENDEPTLTVTNDDPTKTPASLRWGHEKGRSHKMMRRDVGGPRAGAIVDSGGSSHLDKIVVTDVLSLRSLTSIIVLASTLADPTITILASAPRATLVNLGLRHEHRPALESGNNPDVVDAFSATLTHSSRPTPNPHWKSHDGDDVTTAYGYWGDRFKTTGNTVDARSVDGGVAKRDVSGVAHVKAGMGVGCVILVGWLVLVFFT